MFDIGFVELLICGIIALLVLGPERLPTAARAAGRWIGGARRMVNQFTSELDRQLKAEELREKLRKAGDVGLEDVEKSVRGALDEARKYEHMILPDDQASKPRPAPATRRVAQQSDQTATEDQSAPAEPADRQTTAQDSTDESALESTRESAQESPQKDPQESTPESRS